MTFKLHPQLSADCLLLGETSLCQVLLFKNTDLPWVILVPKCEGKKELYQLNETDQQQLALHTNIIGQRLMKYYNGDKLNTGSLGNLVPQLHIHVIVRFATDAAWPKPVWGNLPEKSVSFVQTQQRFAQVQDLCKDLLIDDV